MVRREVFNAGGRCLTEHHDIVNRAAIQPGAAEIAPVVAETGAPWQRAVDPDEVLLFRYSALTFNGHRIHFDRDYSLRMGYPGLVVHGPLIAMMLIDLVREHRPHAVIKHFDYRIVRAPPMTGGPSASVGTLGGWSIRPAVGERP